MRNSNYFGGCNESDDAIYEERPISAPQRDEEFADRLPRYPTSENGPDDATNIDLGVLNLHLVSFLTAAFVAGMCSGVVLLSMLGSCALIK
jgi:hypothetical protein